MGSKTREKVAPSFVTLNRVTKSCDCKSPAICAQRMDRLLCSRRAGHFHARVKQILAFSKYFHQDIRAPNLSKPDFLAPCWNRWREGDLVGWIEKNLQWKHSPHNSYHSVFPLLALVLPVKMDYGRAVAILWILRLRRVTGYRNEEIDAWDRPLAE